MTETITSAIGDYGLYAVFGLMLVDAVFPAASELVMLYAGAVAAGAFAGQTVTLFGTAIESTFWAYVAMATAGTLGYLVGSLIGWAIGFYGGRPFLERRGRWVHLTPEGLDRAEAWFARYGDWAVLLGRVMPVVRSFISIPAGVLEMPVVRYTVLTAIGSAVWCFGIAGAGVAARVELGALPRELALCGLRGRLPRRSRGRLRGLQAPAETGAAQVIPEPHRRVELAPWRSR